MSSKPAPPTTSNTQEQTFYTDKDEMTKTASWGTEGLDNTSPEKEAQQNFSQLSSQETGGVEDINIAIQALGGIAALHFSDRARVIEAFAKVGDPGYAYDLLDVRDPEKLRQVNEAHEIVNKEIAKKDKSAGKKLDKYEVGVGPFKRILTRDTIDRRDQARQVANAVHNRVNAEEMRLKIRNASTIYGIDEGQLKKDMAGWLKKNKGKSVDDYLVVHGRELCRQNPARNDVKEREQKFRKSLKDEVARKEAIKNQAGVVARGRQEILRRLDPNNPILTPEQLKQNIQAALRGAPYQQGQTAQQQPQQQPQQQTSPPQQAVPIQTPPIVAANPPFQRPRRWLQNFSRGIDAINNRIRDAIQRSIIGQIRNLIAQKIASAVAFMVAKKAAMIAAMTAVKAAAASFLTAISGGTFAAIMAAYEGLKKIPIIGGVVGLPEQILKSVVIDGAKFAASIVIMIISVIFIFIFMSPSSSRSMIPDPEARSVENSQPNQTESTTWKLFEKDYILVKKDKKDITLNKEQKWGDWEFFANNNLYFKNSSLTLNSDGHNDVKK